MSLSTSAPRGARQQDGGAHTNRTEKKKNENTCIEIPATPKTVGAKP